MLNCKSITGELQKCYIGVKKKKPPKLIGGYIIEYQTFKQVPVKKKKSH